MASSGGGIYVNVVNWDALVERSRELSNAITDLNSEMNRFGLAIDQVDDQSVRTFSAIERNAEALGKSLRDTIRTTLQGLSSEDAGGAGRELVDNLVEDVQRQAAALEDAGQFLGKSLIEGVVQGILENRASAQETITALASDMASWFAKKLGIRSPSQIFIDLATEIVNGINQALIQGTPLSVQYIEELATKLETAFTAALRAQAPANVNILDPLLNALEDPAIMQRVDRVITSLVNTLNISVSPKRLTDLVQSLTSFGSLMQMDKVSPDVFEENLKQLAVGISRALDEFIGDGGPGSIQGKLKIAHDQINSLNTFGNALKSFIFSAQGNVAIRANETDIWLELTSIMLGIDKIMPDLKRMDLTAAEEQIKKLSKVAHAMDVLTKSFNRVDNIADDPILLQQQLTKILSVYDGVVDKLKALNPDLAMLEGGMKIAGMVRSVVSSLMDIKELTNAGTTANMLETFFIHLTFSFNTLSKLNIDATAVENITKYVTSLRRLIITLSEMATSGNLTAAIGVVKELHASDMFDVFAKLSASNIDLGQLENVTKFVRFLRLLLTNLGSMVTSGVFASAKTAINDMQTFMRDITAAMAGGLAGKAPPPSNIFGKIKAFFGGGPSDVEGFESLAKQIQNFSLVLKRTKDLVDVVKDMKAGALTEVDFQGIQRFVVSLIAALGNLKNLTQVINKVPKQVVKTESLTSFSTVLDSVVNILETIDKFQTSIDALANRVISVRSGASTALGAGIGVALSSLFGPGGVVAALVAAPVGAGLANYASNQLSKYYGLSNVIFGLKPLIDRLVSALKNIQKLPDPSKLDAAMGVLKFLPDFIKEINNAAVGLTRDIAGSRFAIVSWTPIIGKYYALSDGLIGMKPLIKRLVKIMSEFDKIRDIEKLKGVTKTLNAIPDFLVDISNFQSKLATDAKAAAPKGILGETIGGVVNQFETSKGLFSDLKSTMTWLGASLISFKVPAISGAVAAGAGIFGLGGLFSGMLAPLAGGLLLKKAKDVYSNYYRLSDQLFGITPAFKSIAKALKTLEAIQNPERISSIVASFKEALAGIEKFYELKNNYPELAQGNKVWQYFFGVKTGLEPLIPVVKVISHAMSALGQVPNPGGVQTIVGSLSGLVAAIDQLMRIDLSSIARLKKGWFGSSSLEISSSLGNIVIVARVMADAVRELAQVPDAGKAVESATAINKVFDAMAVLDKIPTMDKERAEEVQQAFVALGKGISSFSEVASTNAGAEQASQVLFRLARAFTALQKLTNLVQIAQDLERAAPMIKKAFEALGIDIIAGLTNAIKGDTTAEKAMASMSEDVIETAEKTYQTASPSRVFTRIGKFLTMGLVKGLDEGAPAVTSGMVGVANETKEALNKDSLLKVFMNYGKSLAESLAYGIISGISDVTGKLTSSLKNLGNNLTQSGQTIFQNGQNLAVTGGIVGFLQGQRITMVAEFDQTLKQIETFGGLSAGALSEVEDQILQFSADTIFGPQQSAAAFLDLQKQGLSTADSMNVLAQVGQYAAANQLELENATRGTLTALQIFQLGVDQTGRVVDGYTRAANNSTASAQELSDGMGNVGTIAKEFGLSFEQTTAILALFNDRGIKGAEAGTQLRSMLNGMLRPTEDVAAMWNTLGVELTDAQGNFKSMDAILNDLRTSMTETKTVTTTIMTGLSADEQSLATLAEKRYKSANLAIMSFENGLTTVSEKRRQQLYAERAAAEGAIGKIAGSQQVLGQVTREITRSQIENFRTIQTLAGSYGQQGLAVLLSEDENALETFITEMNELPSSGELAVDMMDTFAGAVESLRGSLDMLSIKAFRPFMDYAVMPFIKLITQGINIVSKLPAPLLGLAAAISVVTTAIITMLGVGMLLLGSFLIPFGYALTTLGTILGGLAFLFFNPITAIGTLALAAGGLTVVVASLTAIVGLVTAITGAVGLYISEASKNDAVVDTLNRLKNTLSELYTTFTEMTGAVGELIGQLFSTSAASNDTTAKFQPLLNMLDSIESKARDVISVFQGIADFAGIMSDVGNISEESSIEAAQTRVDAANAEVATLEKLIRDSGGGEMSGGKKTQTVGAGDTLWGIAQANGLTMEELLALNPNLEATTVSRENQVAAINKQLEAGTLTAEEAEQRVVALGDKAERTTYLISAGQEIIISNQEEINTSNESYATALTAQEEAQDSLNRAIAEEQYYRTWAAKGNEKYYSEEERNVNNIEEKFRQFQETAFGKKLTNALGIDGGDITTLSLLLGGLQTDAKAVLTNINELKNSVISLFSGGSLGDVMSNGLQVLGGASGIFETLTGVDITDKLQTALEQGDWEGVKAWLGAKAVELLQNFAQSVENTLPSIMSGFLRFTFATVPFIMNLLGLDGSQVSSIIGILGDRLGLLLGASFNQAIGVLTGDVSLREGIRNVLAQFMDWEDAQNKVKALEILLERILFIIDIFTNHLELFATSVNDIFIAISGKGFFATLLDGFKAMATGIYIAGAVLSSMFVGILAILNAIFGVVANLTDAFAGLFSGDMDRFYNGLIQAFAEIVHFPGEMLKQMAKTLAGFAKLAGMDEFAYQLNNMGAIMYKVGMIARYVFGQIRDRIKGLIGITKELFSGDVLNEVAKRLKLGLEAIWENFGNIDLKAIGEDIINGLWDGLKSLTKLPGKIKDWINNSLIKPVKDALGIHSPSLVFMDIGFDMVFGLIRGIMGMPGALAGILGSVISEALKFGSELAASLWQGVSDFVSNPGEKLASIANNILLGFNSILGMVGLPDVSAIASNLWTAIRGLFGISDEESAGLGAFATQFKDWFLNQISTAFSQLVSGDFSGALDTVVETLSGVFNSAENINEKLGLSDTIKGWIDSGIDGLLGLLDTLDLTAVKDKLIKVLADGFNMAADFTDSLNIAENVQAAIQIGLATLQSLLPNLSMDNLKSVFSNVISVIGQELPSIEDLGAWLEKLQVVFDWITNTLKTAWDAASSVINEIESGVNKVAGLGQSLWDMVDGEDESAGQAATQAGPADAAKMLAGVTVDAALPPETIASLQLLGASITSQVAIGMTSPSALGLINTAMAAVSATTAGAMFGPLIYQNILRGFGDIPTWVAVNIRDPLISALQALGPAFAQVLNDTLPDSTTLNIQAWLPPGQWETFASTIQIPNPFSAPIVGRKFGGSAWEGRAYETNEGGISEVFRSARGNRTLFLPGEDGMIEPLGRGSSAGNTTVLQDQSVTLNVTIDGSNANFTLDQATAAMNKVLNDYLKNNSASQSLRIRGGI